jgi:hypothetical protein
MNVTFIIHGEEFAEVVSPNEPILSAVWRAYERSQLAGTITVKAEVRDDRGVILCKPNWNADRTFADYALKGNSRLFLGTDIGYGG